MSAHEEDRADIDRIYASRRKSQRRHHAAARSSLSAPRITIRITSSDKGRCNAFASSHGARIQTSRSSSVVKITGMALGCVETDRRARRMSLPITTGANRVRGHQWALHLSVIIWRV
jgi:hypothetical protein